MTERYLPTDKGIEENNREFRLYCRDISHFKPLENEDAMQLARKAQCGDSEAKQELLERSLHIVIPVALNKRFLGVDVMDLISEGNIILMKSINNFDTERPDADFYAYVGTCIKKGLNGVLAKSARTIRLPGHAISEICAIYKVIKDLTTSSEEGEEPDIAEVATALNMPIKKVELRIKQSKRALSLSQPLANDEPNGQTLLDHISQEDDIILPDENAYKESDRKAVRHAFENAQLSPKQREALTYYFALNGSSQSMTYEQIGKKMGTSRSRAGQLIDCGLKNLRRYDRDLWLSLAP